jgi:hypothetical protein
MHRQEGLPVKFYGSSDPLFYRIHLGYPLPFAYNSDLTKCTEIVHKVALKQWRPHFISLSEAHCPTIRGTLCFDLCIQSILSLKGEDGLALYSIHNVYSGINQTWTTDLQDNDWYKTKEYVLFKLSDRYNPI